MNRLAVALGPAWLSVILLVPAVAYAQAVRPACAMLAGVDLKPLLGADHDAPVEFGKTSCRAESRSPGRMVVLMLDNQPPAELKTWLANVRAMTAKHRAREATVVNEPTLGTDAFSIREKGEQRSAEYYATKGANVAVLQAQWAIGAPLSEPVYAQLRGLVMQVQGKLP